MSLSIGNANGYTVLVVGDNTSTSLVVDFYDLIRADDRIHNKIPTGIFEIGSALGATGSLIAGTTRVTISYPSPVPAAGGDLVTIIFTFPGE